MALFPVFLLTISNLFLCSDISIVDIEQSYPEWEYGATNLFLIKVFVPTFSGKQ